MGQRGRVWVSRGDIPSDLGRKGVSFAVFESEGE